jgi:TFIIF-interacting CTD phosphatase-like protein
MNNEEIIRLPDVIKSTPDYNNQFMV